MAISDVLINLLPKVKNHLRVTHRKDDEVIKLEIETAIELIFHDYILKEYDKTTIHMDHISSKVELAIYHIVADFRQNPDSTIQSKNIIHDDRLVRRILSSERKY